MSRRGLLLGAASSLLATGCATAPTVPERRILDIPYTTLGSRPHRLDLYLPRRVRGRPPVVAFFHGGGWAAGDKALLAPGHAFAPWRARMVAEGFAVASVNYRLTSDGAVFPDPVHDVMAALRFLRRESSSLGIDPQRLAVAGDSAGGHLAMMVGTSMRDPEMEGNVGVPGTTSGVRAVISYYGACDMVERFSDHLAAGCPPYVDPSKTSTGTLLGGVDPLDPELRDLARKASPAVRIYTYPSPPLLLFHGTRDCIVPPGQGERMVAAARDVGVPADLVTVPTGHSDPAFVRRGDLQGAAVDFLRRWL